MANDVYRIEIPITATDKTDPALDQAGKKLTRFERAVQRTEQQVKSMNRTRLRLIAEAIDRASAVLSNIGRSARSLAGKTFRFTVRVLDLATKPIRAIISGMTSVVGLLTAGAGAWAGFVKPLELSGDFEQTQIAFTTMLKSGEKATKFLQEAENFANKTPFEFPELATNAKLMMAFGFSIEKVLPMMTTIGDTASGLGAGSEGIERIVRAFGQMRAKGRVMTQELLQLQELGVPAAEILQEELGLTQEQIANIGEEGLEAGKAIDALMKGMDKRFGGMMQQQSRTMKGLLSTIKDTFSNKILRRWGDGLREGVTPYMMKFVDWIDKNQDTVTKWGEALKNAGRNIANWVVEKVEQWRGSVSDLVNSQEWREAKTFGEKVKLAWDKLIEEPFQEWWAGKGKEFVTDAAAKIGKGMGGAIGGFIMSALGVVQDPSKAGEESIFLEAGTTAGKAFLDAFLEAFDAQKIADKAWEAFKSGQGKAFSGESNIEAWIWRIIDIWMLSKVFKGAGKGAKGAKGAWDLLKGIFKGGKTVSTAAGAASATAEAAATAAKAAKTVDILGPNGQVLKTVIQNADDASRIVGAASKGTKATGWLGKVLGLGGKGAKGIPLAGWILGGLGSAATIAAASPESRAKETVGEAGSWLGGLAAGAGAGALVGTLGGGPIGTAIGGIIGGIGGAIGGEAFAEWIYDQKDKIAEALGLKKTTFAMSAPYSSQAAMDRKAFEGLLNNRNLINFGFSDPTMRTLSGTIPAFAGAPVPLGPSVLKDFNLKLDVKTQPQYNITTSADPNAVLDAIKAKNREVADLLGAEITSQLDDYIQNSTNGSDYDD